jgi:endonuclease G
MHEDYVQRMEEAAVRYEERVSPAESDQDSKPSPRTKYLAKSLARVKAEMLAAKASAAGLSYASDKAVSSISRERIIGNSDLLDFNYLELAIAVGRGVARIRLSNGFGTGFLVGPGLIMTNHHVIGDEGAALSASAQFDYQDNASGELLSRHDYRLNPTSFFMTDPALDFTIVGLERESNRGRSVSAYPWLKLIADLGKGQKGESVSIIQHPRGGLKQIALRENEIIDIPGGVADFLYYTTDTEPGSSGSPCFNDQWEIIALHHSGVPKRNSQGEILRTDGKVWRKEIDPDALVNWVCNEGARASAMVAALKAAVLRPEWSDLREEMLQSSPPNPIELARLSASSANLAEKNSGIAVLNTIDSGTAEHASPEQSCTWTIPVNITISTGKIQSNTSSRKSEGESEEFAAEITIDQHWENRKGYNPKFLGPDIPLPQLTEALKNNTVEIHANYQMNGEKYILNYLHHSVAINKARRCAWFSAAMVDGTKFKDFKRGKDKWFLDPRIDRKYQMGEELYAAEGTDRGHLTRFKDISWGETMEEAVKATNDSFHFTNAALQLSGFNQGKERWQGLERFLLEEHARKDERKIIVITGPVLLNSDPLYVNEFMTYKTRIPLAFWKVCCLRRHDGSLSATGFKLGQEDITKLPGFEEKFDVAAAQVTIAELEALTGLDFGVLKQHDHFAMTGDPGTLEVERLPNVRGKVKPIEYFADIVV